jgi:TatA/E family protein of Tat protein translocase
MLAPRACAASRPRRCPAASISACAAAAAGFRARGQSLGGASPSPSSSPARAAPLSSSSTNQCTQQQRTNLAGGLACPSSSRVSNKHNTSTITRSFLGVGAPEAVLVGVVALVVFGPKGLAEAARSVGQALRAFQPTIREVVEVSQDLKGTLEKELGLDEIRSAASSTTAAAAAAQRAAQQAVLGGSGDEAASTSSSSSSSSKPAAAAAPAPEEEDPDIEA